MKKNIIPLFGFLCSLGLLSAQLPFYGGHSMVRPLRRVLVKRPDQAFVVSNPQQWHYTSSPNLARAQQEHDEFVETLKNNDVEVVYHDAFLSDMADAIFVHDPVIITNQGAVLLSMGKFLRAGEPGAIAACLEKIGVPILSKLTGMATAEGGDCLWLDDKTLAVGQGFRTNGEGIAQLTKILGTIGVDVLPVQLPFYQGPEACLHLQSLISLVDEKVAVVYKPLMPITFIQDLQVRGFTLIDVPEEEFLTMGPNILAIKPGLCLTIEGNPITKQRLESAGITVLLYRGHEISLKAEGGATCLTRPLLRG